MIKTLLCIGISAAGCSESSAVTMDAANGSGGEFDATSGVNAAGDASPAETADATGAAPGDGGGEPASTFRCGNWADPRDNFVNGNLQLSGLSIATDTYATVVAKSNAILAALQTTAGLNSVRIPINEPTVLGAWWSSYKGAIDAAVARGMRVLVSYWAWHNARPDDIAQFNSMWTAVVNEYANNDLVYFQIFNEPWAYQPEEFISLAVDWLGVFPNVPRSRVIVAGSYSDGDVNIQGADPRLQGTLLSIHIYAAFSTNLPTTVQDWQTTLQERVGPYGNRVIVTEWGAPMTTGTDYTGNGDGDATASYVTAISSYIGANHLGSCYWPILRNGDAWGLTTLSGTGTDISLAVNNASGMARLQSSFGL